jgi:hypothetical protein
MVKITDTKAMQFKRGSTVSPVLSIVKWVDRPDCLKDGAAAGIAMDPPAPKAAPAAPVVPAAPAGDDSLEF